MTKKYIKDMSKEELVKVFHANSKLKDDIYEDMVESEMLFVSEQLDYLRDSLSDWSIGTYNRNYMTIGDSDKFIEGMIKLDNSIPLLIEDDLPKLKEAVELRDKYRNTDVDSEEFEDLEEEVDEVAEELADLAVMRFTRRLDGLSKEEYQIDYFLDFYVDARLEEDGCYILADMKDYILYEDVVKSYK